MSITFSPYMIAIALSKRNDHSSLGPDNIPYTVLKNGGYHLHMQLSRLFQLCLNKGMVPMEWKAAHVTPILKKGNKKKAANYRPVSLTSCICKVMESCRRDAIWSFWSQV